MGKEETNANITIHKQEGQWNIKSEQKGMPIDRIITQAYHQKVMQVHNSTSTWLETRNMHIPSKYLQFQIKRYENCQKFKA